MDPVRIEPLLAEIQRLLRNASSLLIEQNVDNYIHLTNTLSSIVSFQQRLLVLLFEEIKQIEARISPPAEFEEKDYD